MNPKRIYSDNHKPNGDGPVVYWMDRDIRVHDNWALVYADQIAREENRELIVVYNLVTNFLGGGERQWKFKLEGLQEVAETLAEMNIEFQLLVDDSDSSSKSVSDFLHQSGAGVVVTDFSPLKIQRKWKREVEKKFPHRFVEVDAHNIVPVHVTSDKQEFAAYTIRPKIHKNLPEFLEDFLKMKEHEEKSKSKKISNKINWDSLLDNKNVDRDFMGEVTFIGGEKEAHKHLKHFLKHSLRRYALERNDPLSLAVSNLSPYLHYGMISAERVALEVVEVVGEKVTSIIESHRNKAKAVNDRDLTLTDHAGAFLEELIVRRELSDNFCLYNENYDNPDGFPEWAQKSLHKHAKDKREKLYTKHEFEKAETHDDLWNASQMEMVKSGKMHGYMRMYWCKKILEWSKSPEEAQRIAIYLNDRYELDGRDPNGYTGIAWSIGGVHDRPWFTRPIFGEIRYMARSGCEKKFDVEKYIAKWLGK